eukprot:2213394-Prorocentrum_lima.AAC.1
MKSCAELPSPRCNSYVLRRGWLASLGSAVTPTLHGSFYRTRNLLFGRPSCMTWPCFALLSTSNSPSPPRAPSS